MVAKRFDVFLAALDPTVGREIKKTRPCLIISPDDMNQYISTVIIAPMSTKGKAYPSRIACKFQGKQGLILLDQIHTIDKRRLIRKLGHLNKAYQPDVLATLLEMFSE